MIVVVLDKGCLGEGVTVWMWPGWALKPVADPSIGILLVSLGAGLMDDNLLNAILDRHRGRKWVREKVCQPFVDERMDGQKTKV